MSSRGQVVIPQDVREEVCVGEGTVFAVMAGKDMIMLKKMETPSKESLIKDLKRLAREGRNRIEEKGLKERDLHEFARRVRHR